MSEVLRVHRRGQGWSLGEHKAWQWSQGEQDCTPPEGQQGHHSPQLEGQQGHHRSLEAEQEEVHTPLMVHMKEVGRLVWVKSQ